MMTWQQCLALGAVAAIPTANALRTSLGGLDMPIGSVILQHEDEMHAASMRANDPLAVQFPAHVISVPIDYFHNESRYEPHTNETFDLRYWFDASFFEPGGPVFVLQGGETSGADRLPFLQKGIIHQLAEATHGIAVVLEHRYYGSSFPVPDLSTENLRFLTTEQSMADQVFFAQNVQFPGLEHLGDLTSATLPYIAYGGSYAGAFVAFLRVQYPDVFWGAISSSGVTKAIYDYWQYNEPIIESGPRDCISTLQTFVEIVDNIILEINDHKLTQELKDFFGMPNVTHLEDFAGSLTGVTGGWQAQNWDPAVSSPSFSRFCANITSTDLLYPETAKLKKQAARMIEKGGYESNTTFVHQLLNYVGLINATEVAKCAARGVEQDVCFGSYDHEAYQNTSLSVQWRAWPYQYCTEWGYLVTGASVPATKQPIVSRAVDIEHQMQICKHAFNITTAPEVDRINKYGGYDISYPRLAIVDGDRDPWRPATPHAIEFGAKPRQSTISEPFILIENAIHHFDENGRFPNETTPDLPPAPVLEAQAQELEFVKAWLVEWAEEKQALHRDL